ncbi:MAG: hypothetical protein ACI853_002345, partial [Paracoccaceae bacterium]
PMPGMKTQHENPVTGSADQVKDTARQPQNHPPARLSPVHCNFKTVVPSSGAETAQKSR